MKMGSRRSYLPRSVARRRAALMGALTIAMAITVMSLGSVKASGVVWLAPQQATSGTSGLLHPSVVTQGGHVYVLTTSDKGVDPAQVNFSTNESGAWKTETLSSQGPRDLYSAEFAALTADPATGKLYAVWFFKKSENADAIALAIRDAAGNWTRAADLQSTGYLGGDPSVVAASRKVYVAFSSSDFPGACDDSTQRSGDIQVATYDGSAWSTPQNLTSCVND